MKTDIELLEAKSRQLVRRVFEMSYRSGGGHLSTALSLKHLLPSLYYTGLLKFDPKNPKWEGRDRFILSEGQAGLALYAVLADLGFFSVDELERCCLPGGILGTHAESNIPGVELLTGSLGHGLPVATGIAAALRSRGSSALVVVLLGDGELYEGSNWEALFTAKHLRLGHLIVILNRNGGATIGHLEGSKPNDGPNQELLFEKFCAFGFKTARFNGHDLKKLSWQLPTLLDRTLSLTGIPTCIIADTVKGKGIRAMEDGSFFPTHYRLPTGVDLIAALHDLDIDPDEFKAKVGDKYIGY